MTPIYYLLEGKFADIIPLVGESILIAELEGDIVDKFMLDGEI